MLVFSRENGKKSIIEDCLFQGFAWEASSRSPSLVGPLLVSRSIFAGFLEGKCKKSIIEDGLFQGFAWEASSRSPSLVGPLLVSRSIFACFLEGKWQKVNH